MTNPVCKPTNSSISYQIVNWWEASRARCFYAEWGLLPNFQSLLSAQVFINKHTFNISYFIKKTVF